MPWAEPINEPQETFEDELRRRLSAIEAGVQGIAGAAAGAALKQQLNAVYAERDMCIALIARMALRLGLCAGIGRHVGEGWDDDWRHIIFVELPAGQVSWHIHDSELPLFSFLDGHCAAWDGHDTAEKYRRVREPGL